LTDAPRVSAAALGAAATPGNDLSAAGSGGAFGARGNGEAAQANIRITPDIVNNSILVYASQETQRIVEQTLRQIEFSVFDKPGFWELRGYHNYGDPWLEQRYDEET